MRALGFGAFLCREVDLDRVGVAESYGAFDTLLVGETANRESVGCCQSMRQCMSRQQEEALWPVYVRLCDILGLLGGNGDGTIGEGPRRGSMGDAGEENSAGSN